MTVTLTVIAGIIFAVYSIYFIKIISGNPDEFEKELLAALKDWSQKNNGKKSQIRLIFSISLIVELFYFLMVFLVIYNPVFVVFTILFAGVELFHIYRIGINVHKFLKGIIESADLFNWKLERLSAILFFTHSLLSLINVFLF